MVTRTVIDEGVTAASEDTFDDSKWAYGSRSLRIRIHFESYQHGKRRAFEEAVFGRQG
jgi:hypothetical protein